MTINTIEAISKDEIFTDINYVKECMILERALRLEGYNYTWKNYNKKTPKQRYEELVKDIESLGYTVEKNADKILRGRYTLTLNKNTSITED